MHTTDYDSDYDYYFRQKVFKNINEQLPDLIILLESIKEYLYEIRELMRSGPITIINIDGTNMQKMLQSMHEMQDTVKLINVNHLEGILSLAQDMPNPQQSTQSLPSQSKQESMQPIRMTETISDDFSHITFQSHINYFSYLIEKYLAPSYLMVQSVFKNYPLATLTSATCIAGILYWQYHRINKKVPQSEKI
ncbi:MAG: hypothetical protein WA432_04300 [Candidatus Babeliaceae bacterium]